MASEFTTFATIDAGQADGTDTTLVYHDAGATLGDRQRQMALTELTSYVGLNVDNLTTGSFAANVVDPDPTFAADSDTRLPTQKAVAALVMSSVNGLSWKDACRAATTGSGTLATDFENGDTLDGVTLATNDRILIKNQGTATQNGIYKVNASGAPTRTTDADTGAEMLAAAVVVLEGTANAGTQWNCNTPAPITLGSTNLTFAQIAVGGGTYTAGTGLALVGNEFAVDATVVQTGGSYPDPAWIPSLAASKLTGAVALAKGGTGQTTRAPALNALMPTQSGKAGYRFTSDGTDVFLGLDFQTAASDEATYADLDPSSYSAPLATANAAAAVAAAALGATTHGRLEFPRGKFYTDQMAFGQDHSNCDYHFSRGSEFVNRAGYKHVLVVDCYQIVTAVQIDRIGYVVGVSIPDNDPVPQTFTGVDVSGGDPEAISVDDLIYFGNYYNYQLFQNVQAARLVKVTGVSGAVIDTDGYCTVPQSSAILLDVTIAGGVITGIAVRAGSDQGHLYGTTYTNPVDIIGDGTGAAAHLNVNGSGVVLGVVVDSGGSGYTDDGTVAIAPTPLPYAKYIRGGKRVASRTDTSTVRLETHADAALGVPGQYAALIRGVIWFECALSMHKIYAVNAATGDVIFETPIADEDWIDDQMCVVFDPPQNMAFDGAKIGGTVDGSNDSWGPSAYTVFLRACANVTLKDFNMIGGDPAPTWPHAGALPGQFHICSAQYVTLENCDGVVGGNACSDLTILGGRLRGWETHASVRRVRIHDAEIDNYLNLFAGTNDMLLENCTINASVMSTGEIDRIIWQGCRFKRGVGGGSYWNGPRCEWLDTRCLDGNTLTVYVQAGCTDWVIKRCKGIQFVMDAGSTGFFEDVDPVPLGDLTGWTTPLDQPAGIGVQTVSSSILTGVYADDVVLLQQWFDNTFRQRLNTAFTPALVPGIFFWGRAGDTNFQSSDGTGVANSNNDPVGFIGDLTGQGNHCTQVTSGKRPLLKTNAINTTLPVWAFDGSDDFLLCLNALNALDGGWWAFAVVRPDDTAGGVIIGGGTTGHDWLLHDTTNVQNLVRTNQALIATGAASLSTSGYSGAGVRYTGASTLFFLNGAQDGTLTTASGGFSNPTIYLGISGGTTAPWKGRIAEIVLGSGQLADSDAIKIQAYLNTRYAIY